MKSFICDICGGSFNTDVDDLLQEIVVHDPGDDEGQPPSTESYDCCPWCANKIFSDPAQSNSGTVVLV